MLSAVAFLAAVAWQAPGTAQRDSVPARPDASAIMALAIAHRRAGLSGVRGLRYDVGVKFVAREADDTTESARSIALISETRSQAYWEWPGRYLETMVARRRSGHAGRDLPSISEIADAEQDRIVLEAAGGARPGGEARGRGGRNGVRAGRYVIVSPLASDAFDHYAFALIDTITLNGRAAWRLAFHPRSDAAPLLSGTIDVADSAWDVLDFDADFTPAVSFAAAADLHLTERFANAGHGLSLAVEIRFTGEIRPRVTGPAVPREIAGVQIAGLPRHLRFEQLAMRDSFDFDAPRPPEIGEYRMVVAERADQPDSGAWTSADAVPLSDAERDALARADSSQRHPRLVPRLVRDGESVSRLAQSPGFFHYNRVDGVYLGAAHDWPVGSRFTLTSRLGYGTGSELWQYRVGGRVQLSPSRRLWAGAWYYDETTTRPTFVSTGYNPTFRAFLAHSDPLDYYRERGFALSAGAKLVDRTRLEVGYTDAWQSTLDTIPGGTLRVSRFPPRPNPPIVAGRLRSVSGILSWDSRSMMRSDGQDSWLGERSWTRAAVGVEAAAPSVIPDAFAFRRYTARLVHQQHTLAGSTTIALSGGIATGDVPPQRYFGVDYGMGVLAVDGIQFNTLRRTNFYGTRAASLALRHDFDGRPFRSSGIPLLRAIPFTVSLHGGVFWTDFGNHAALPGDSIFLSAPVPYREAGFSIGNLTPFLAPINFSASFTWQISGYPTQRFRFGIGLTGF